MYFRLLLLAAVIVTAAPANAAIETRCWLQPEPVPNASEPVVGFAVILDGVRQIQVLPPIVPPKVLNGTSLCPAGGPDCDKYCTDVDVTRPYTWDVVAVGADGETLSSNGPAVKLLPPTAPILLP